MGSHKVGMVLQDDLQHIQAQSRSLALWEASLPSIWSLTEGWLLYVVRLFLVGSGRGEAQDTQHASTWKSLLLHADA